MTAIDTGICAPESVLTLLRQQMQLTEGRRDVQMFPAGTEELPLPEGLARHANARGVFHFRDGAISRETIEALSKQGRENLFLKLGPFSKSDIAARALSGEAVTCIAEYTPAGIELRCAAGTDGTIEEQREYFDRTKEPDGIIVIGQLPARVAGTYRG
jgi:hypothetical protein